MSVFHCRCVSCAVRLGTVSTGSMLVWGVRLCLCSTVDVYPTLLGLVLSVLVVPILTAVSVSGMRDGLITTVNQPLRTTLCVIHETTLIGVPGKAVTNSTCCQIRLPRRLCQFPSFSTCIHSFPRIVLVLPRGQSRLGIMLNTRCNGSCVLFCSFYFYLYGK
jgi:hypothetical protein